MGLFNASQAHEPQRLSCLLENPLKECPHTFLPQLVQGQATPEVGESWVFTLRTDPKWLSITTHWMMDPLNTVYIDRCRKETLTRERTFPSACLGLIWLQVGGGYLGFHQCKS